MAKIAPMIIPMSTSKILFYFFYFFDVQVVIQYFLFSHVDGEDCDTCGPKITSADDVADVEVPEWKKKALAAEADAAAAPFGMNWGTEATVSATDASKKVEESHSHTHDHGHS